MQTVAATPFYMKIPATNITSTMLLYWWQSGTNVSLKQTNHTRSKKQPSAADLDLDPDPKLPPQNTTTRSTSTNTKHPQKTTWKPPQKATQ